MLGLGPEYKVAAQDQPLFVVLYSAQGSALIQEGTLLIPDAFVRLLKKNQLQHWTIWLIVFLSSEILCITKRLDHLSILSKEALQHNQNFTEQFYKKILIRLCMLAPEPL